MNYAVNRYQQGNVVADQANLGAHDVVAGDVNQDLSIDQEAVLWNGVTIDAAAGGGMYVIIGNDGSNYAGGFAEGNLIAVQSNEAFGNVDAGDVSQSFLIEQTSGVHSEIVISAGDDGDIQAGIFNGGIIGTGNYAYGVEASIQKNAGGYLVNAGNVGQSELIQQSAAVYNEIIVDGDKAAFASQKIENDAEIFAVNYAESLSFCLHRR